ncbi:MAG TPA: hypothetical protein VIK14_15135 [Ignavibacteria bacterium]
MDLKNYKKIIRLLYLSFFINSIILVFLNISAIHQCFISIFSEIKAELIIQIFFGALGSTISCSLYLATDKEINELESKKAKPDPKILREPDEIDISLYIHRIISGSVLAILGSLIILAGLSYFEVNYTNFSIKQKILISASSIMIGLFQHKFLDDIKDVYCNIFNKSQFKCSNNNDDSLKLLNSRLVKGEINIEEYEKFKKALKS